jgi:predicted RNase H-like HicB family nuclease
MSHYHVLVEQEDGWYIGRVLERPGITTQGRTLDELVLMVRDAIDAMWSERDTRLELVLGRSVGAAKLRKRRPARKVA